MASVQLQMTIRVQYHARASQQLPWEQLGTALVWSVCPVQAAVTQLLLAYGTGQQDEAQLRR